MNIEKLRLPSNGMLGYEKEVRVRALMGEHLSTIYSSFNKGAIDTVIEDIIEPKIDIKVLADEDKNVILHKARALTFGNEIKLNVMSPFSNEIQEVELNYDNFEITYLEDDTIFDTIIEVTDIDGKVYKITKRVPNEYVWDDVEQYKRRYNPKPSLSYIILQASKVGRVNGKVATISEIVDILANKLGAKELVRLTDFLKTDFGMDMTYTVECEKTGTAFTGGLAITADLFR